MNSRITPDHLGRAAVVYVRQSTMAQVTGNLESQRRQYDLAGAAEAMRCGRCGRMMRVFYGNAKGNAHRYQCRGDDAHVGAGLCIGIGGVRIDRAVALQLLEAVSDRAVEAAIFASDQAERSRKDVIAAVEREFEAARYDASLAARRYELVDPAKRHVARELEARWNDAWSG